MCVHLQIEYNTKVVCIPIMVITPTELKMRYTRDKCTVRLLSFLIMKSRVGEDNLSQ